MDMKLSEFMEVYFEDKQNELKERTMKNKRYIYSICNCMNTFKIKFRWKFVCSVSTYYCDCKSIYTSFVNKVFGHFRICIEISRIDMRASLCRIRVISYMSKLSLDGCPIRVRDVCQLFNFSYIFFLRICRAGVHNG